MRKIKLDIDKIKILYIEERLSVPSIAKILEVSNNTIYRSLFTNGVEIRSARDAKLSLPFTGKCSICNKLIDAKSKCKRCSDRQSHNAHLEKRKEKQKAYRTKIKNTAEYKDYFKRYAKDHKESLREYKRINKGKRRSIIKEGNFSIKDWREQIKKQENKCAYCQIECKLTLDHIIPLSKGGRHIASNICGACMKCNNRKSAKSVETWLKEG